MTAPRTWSAVIESAQHRAALALGIDERRRTETVVTMLENNRRRAPAYWIQLFLAMGIATLGLVLSSTAVVIGAMLVSPLMGPILELGMGFAVGSAFLVFRAFLRVLLSIAVVVSGAALLTVSLPFHEVTAEIASRAAPTALDLLVAVFCALTAAYTTVRQTSDTTSAAAGTAIGIALVPPLCAIGFGLGTGSPSIAGGAALLFVANLSAILVFSVLSFFLLGYNQVNAQQVEQDIGAVDTTRTDVIAAKAEAVLHRAFGSRFGVAMRFVIPLVFLAAVYVPLRAALNEVTWEVRARDAIRRILASEAPSAVQTAITVERHTVSLRLVVVSSNERVAEIEMNIRARIRENTGVTPDVVITAVPDARMLAAATANRTSTSAPTEAIELGELQSRTTTAVREVWPTATAGQLVGWNLVVVERGAPTLVLYHIGPPVGGAGAELLAGAIATRTGATFAIADSTLVATEAIQPLGSERRFIVQAAPILAWASRATGAVVCARGPVATDRRTTVAQRDAITMLRRSAPALAGRLTLVDSSAWRLSVQGQACAAPDSTPANPAPATAPGRK
ncbi:MAG TPA: DUF389 domain-containing protein [Gemmatimonadaceae bacterium]